MRKNHGFAIMELLIIVIVVAIIGALGVIGYNRWRDANTQTANTNQPQTTASSAPQIKTTSDLDTATKALDQAPVASNGADQLASQSSAF